MGAVQGRILKGFDFAHGRGCRGFEDKCKRNTFSPT